jgi:hypothetical protein
MVVGQVHQRVAGFEVPHRAAAQVDPEREGRALPPVLRHPRAAAAALELRLPELAYDAFGLIGTTFRELD